MNTPTKAASQVPVSTRIADPPAIALAVALNCTSTAVFVAHADGYLVHSNLAGARMLQSEHALRKVQSRLVARRSDEAKALNAVLSRVAESGQSELLRLLNRNGTGRLLITVNPVPGHTMVTLCVADLEPTDADLTVWFKQAFQLSQQNAELAAGLMSGLSLSEFSAQKAITLGATRTRLKKLFAQTGTRSQAALLSALLRAAAVAIPQAGKGADLPR